jgi:hypothetical protein
MTARLDVAKVIFGAFVVPWWNRRAFGRALAVPLMALVALALAWYFAAQNLSHESISPLLVLTWAFGILYGVLFALFAVTCHRLVLLDPQTIASRVIPSWSRRETKFFLWLVVIWLIAMGIILVLTTLMLNLLLPFKIEAEERWFRPALLVVQIPAFYVLGRLSLVLPATAVDQKPNLKWAWAATKGNGWRLFLVVAVLPWTISGAVHLLGRSDASVVEIVILTFVGCALFAVEIAALSLSYRELTKDVETPLKGDA